jgi:hypothetical protein
MDAQVGNVFQQDWSAKFLNLIFGGMMFLGSGYPLYALFFLHINIHASISSTVFVVLLLLVMMMVGCTILLLTTVKVTVTSNVVIQSNWIKTKIIPLSSILTAKRVFRSNGKGGANFLLIKTKQSSFSMGFGLPKKKIDEAVTAILEQIRIHYPANFIAIEEEKSKEQSDVLENFWRK